MVRSLARKAAFVASLALAMCAGCKDVDSFSTAPGEAYCGSIVNAGFVTLNLAPTLKMRMTFDADRMASFPGELSTDDGFLANAPMRPIEQLFRDPLLTLQFGEGRDKNLVYMVDPSDVSRGPTVTVILSLLHSGDAEVRLLRGAPITPDASNAPSPGDGVPLFGVFAPLVRQVGRCSF
jgi:hypothetical protein